MERWTGGPSPEGGDQVRPAQRADAVVGVGAGASGDAGCEAVDAEERRVRGEVDDARGAAGEGVVGEEDAVEALGSSRRLGMIPGENGLVP